MTKYSFLGLFLLFAFLVVLVAGCSTTSALPEDEQLYTGIEKITYVDDPDDVPTSYADSVGVITAVGNAVEAVSEILSGAGTVSRLNKENLSKEEKKALKAQQKQANKDFATAKVEVEAVLAYPPNGAIFGSSSMQWPWKFGLSVYNKYYDSQKGFGKWMFRNFSSDPVLITTVSPDVRTKVATNTLHNYGYFNGTVTYNVLTQKNPKKAKIRYNVRAGDLFRLDSVAYLKYPSAMDSLLRVHHDERLLLKDDAFSVLNLSSEQTRIETIMQENGFYYFEAGYTTFRADTTIRKNYVQLQVVPSADMPEKASHPWYIGNTYIHIRDNNLSPTDKNFSFKNYSISYSGDKMPVKPSVWLRSIALRHGRRYSVTADELTQEKLSSLGILSQYNVNFVPRDTTSTCDTLDVVINAAMDKLYDSTFEMTATFKSNQQVGPGVSYELAKRNAFRGAEKVSFKVYGSYEWQTGSGSEGSNSLLNSYELGAQLALTYPRFVVPGLSLQKSLTKYAEKVKEAKDGTRVPLPNWLRYQATTQFSFDANWKNRSSFFNMISLELAATYSWYTRPTIKHEFTVFSLEFNKLRHTTTAFDSIMDANPALYVSMRDQFIPSISYTFTAQSRSSNPNPWWVQFSVKEAGNITSAIYAACGESFNKKDKELFDNPFAQFIKFTAEAHKTFTFTEDVCIATRIFGGIIYSYGNSSSAPYTDQFYVGGANSIRAFTVRSLGPGSYKAAESKYAYMDQTGDFKLEANIELRARLCGDLFGAVFLDAGNVWLLRSDENRPGSKLSGSSLKKIALGTGAGLRYDLEFLVLRFDLGIALHAPYDTSKSGFYNIEKFKDGIGFHFAIGYPF